MARASQPKKPRLARQADRTRPMRLALYEKIGFAKAHSILDVGCGDGIVTEDLRRASRARLAGLDNDPRMVERARRRLRRFADVTIEEGDAHALPFGDGRFDVAICHLTLMWVRDPARVVAEMARVVRRDGRVVAAMEPDYGGKIHEPENPVVDHVFADEAIRRRGGDPHMGRKLRALFVRAGLKTEVGLLNPDIPSNREDLATYDVERGMYRKMLLAAGLAGSAIDGWEREYVASLESDTQFNWLPMFWAVGRKTSPARRR